MRNNDPPGVADTLSRPVLSGRPHVALRGIAVQVLEYDALGVRVEHLEPGAVFQPWEPQPHWRGVKVPITLGDGSSEFDWGVTSAEGRFVAWNDFFEACAPAGSVSVSPSQAAPPPERPDPFATDDRGRTPLFELAARGDRAAAWSVLSSLAGTGIYPQRRALLEVQDDQGLTAADVAEQNGHRTLAKELRYEWMRMEMFE